MNRQKHKCFLRWCLFLVILMMGIIWQKPVYARVNTPTQFLTLSVVSRSTDKLDVFAVGQDRYVYTAAWAPNGNDWQGWWKIGDLQVTLAMNIAVVSRSTDKLDVFALDPNGYVDTAAWAPNGNGWQGWWKIGNLQPSASQQPSIV